MWGGIPESMKEDFIFPNVTPSTNESKSTYGVPTEVLHQRKKRGKK